MSTFAEEIDAQKRCTGRVMVMEIRPEFNDCSQKTVAFDVGSLDAPEMMPAGSCRAPTHETSLKFYATGASR